MMWTLLCSISFLICLGHSASIPLPSSTGPCDVLLHASELVDIARTDPYDPKGGKRSVMVTSFTPVNCKSVSSISYFPNATAKSEDKTFQALGIVPETFESFRLQVQKPQQRSPSSNGHYPVVLFSPAVDTSRLMYTLLLQEISSNGFAVISVDHPYDADIVEYPDGRTVLGIMQNQTDAEMLSAQGVRVKDMSFVLDQMQKDKVKEELFPLSKRNKNLLSLDRVSIFGHSLGGATSAQTMLVDDRFVGGINLDGEMWGSVVDKGLLKPFLLFGHANYTQAKDDSWKRFWLHSRGWKLELELAQSAHYTFSDFPILVDAISISQDAREITQAERIGTIGGLRSRNVIASYITATLEYFIYGKLSHLLHGPSVSYPDVNFVSSRS